MFKSVNSNCIFVGKIKKPMQHFFLNPTFPAYWMKARLNMLLGNTEDAIACFERVSYSPLYVSL